MKDLGFNKFDRNAVIYYFLVNNSDWKNYNMPPQKAMSGETPYKLMEGYRSKDFGLCLNSDDYAVMKAMGLPVNLPADWKQIEESGQKKELSSCGSGLYWNDRGDCLFACLLFLESLIELVRSNGAVLILSCFSA